MFRAWAGGLQHGSGYASAFNCLMVRFNLVIRGRLDDVRVDIPYRVYLGFPANIIIPIGYTLTMMIVTHSRSTVIIVIRNTYFTQLTNCLTKQLTKWEPVDEGQRKRAFAFALALFLCPCTSGACPPGTHARQRRGRITMARRFGSSRMMGGVLRQAD